MTQAVQQQMLPRRKIGELIARYELEPELRDLFVEGPRDQEIYSWYLENSGYKNVAVFEIETVEIPHDVLASHGLSSGNRARVIALALELDKQFPELLRYVRCIADSDFDFIFTFRIDANHLLYTDYTSIDLYTSNEVLLAKVMRLSFNMPDTEVQPLFDCMFPIFQDVFIIRAANQKLGWGMSLVSFVRCCKVNGALVTFDKSDFVNRCLDANGRRNERTMFDELCRELQTVYLDNPRKSIHGDDYYELIGWYLRRRRGWDGYRQGNRSIMANLVAALDDRLLSGEKLFVELDEVFR